MGLDCAVVESQSLWDRIGIIAVENRKSQPESKHHLILILLCRPTGLEMGQKKKKWKSILVFIVNVVFL